MPTNEIDIKNIFEMLVATYMHKIWRMFKHGNQLYML